MIQFIRGRLTDVEEDRVLVETGGIGYGIYMPAPAMANLPPVGEEVLIHTYLNVKEDDLQLFGFLNREDLDLFQQLITVSGIGPKGALGILSAMSADDLRMAVLSNDVKAIAAAPGIGKKTAEKLILELKDKLSMEDVLDHASGAEPGTYPSQVGDSDTVSDAVQALVALGYGNSEALRAVRQVDIKPDTTVNEVLKNALKFLSF